MPQLRRNVLTGEWVSIAEERANRPSSFKGIGLNDDESCPFCKGNEHLTPKDIYKSADGRVRIIKNKYPVLKESSKTGYGIHDVLIDTDIHDEKLHDFSVCNIEKILVAIKKRIIDIETDKHIKYIQVFKNHGILGGASQPHSHWQIVGMPIIPQMQENIYKNSLDIYTKTGKCHICSNVIHSANKDLNVYENQCFVAYCDYAPKFSYQLNIAPKTHYESFNAMDEALFKSLAEILKKCLSAITKLFPGIDYNILFMNAPVNAHELNTDCLHFFIQIIPRRGYLAGLELSTLCHINCVSPENAASALRNAMVF